MHFVCKQSDFACAKVSMSSNAWRTKRVKFTSLRGFEGFPVSFDDGGTMAPEQKKTKNIKSFHQLSSIGVLKRLNVGTGLD